MSAVTLNQAMELLAAKHSIRDCVNRYGRGIDRHDEDLLRSVFHADAIDNHGDATHGREEFIRWGHEWHEDVSVAHSHQMTSHISDVAGNEAHALTYVIFCLARKDGVTLHIGGGRYIDRLQCRDGVWRIIVRRITIDWRFDANTASADRLTSMAHGRWGKSDPSYRLAPDLP